MSFDIREGTLWVFSGASKRPCFDPSALLV
jgi:hypothetical protein